MLFNGRNITVQLGEPISLRGLLGGEADTASAARRVARALRTQLARARAARIGPDLSHRRTIVAEVLRTRAVRQAVAQDVRDAGERAEDRRSRREMLLEARRCIDEIAANYSHTFVTSMSHLLTRLWNRLYDGVEFQHVETLPQVADGNEIVYVPCHRSHMDYLLLSYAIYQHGYAMPHIAAGLNLNLPVVGRFLRKGGAFFMRRSFRGNSLYTVVFMKYLAAIMARGHSIEYFIEGGRSRTGRLLAPMTGMLSMTVRSYLREPRRPVVFVPVYFGYERIFEGATYIGELSGRPKEKESVLGLLRSLHRLARALRPRARQSRRADLPGQRCSSGTRRTGARTPATPRTAALGGAAGGRAGAAPSCATSMPPPASRRSTCWRSRCWRRRASRCSQADLLRQIDTLLAVLRDRAVQRSRHRHRRSTPRQIVDYGVKLKMITRETHRAGEFVRMSAGARGARHLLPQQRAAPVGDALADGLLLPRQRRAAHGRHPALGRPHLSVHRRRAVPALARGCSCRPRSTKY